MCLDVKLIQYESYYSVFYPFLNIVLWVSFSVKTIGFLKIIQLALLLQIWAQFFFILTFIIEIEKKLVFHFSICSLDLWQVWYIYYLRSCHILTYKHLNSNNSLTEQGAALFSGKSCTVNTLAFVGHIVSISAMHFCISQHGFTCRQYINQ